MWSVNRQSLAESQHPVHLCSEEWKLQADRCPGPVGHTLNREMEACVSKVLFFQIIEFFCFVFFLGTRAVSEA